MNELSLFTGMGGGIYGSLILGWQTVAYVEKDEYCRQIIAQRIKDGWFDAGDIYGDIKEFNGQHAHKYTGQIDIITGGFPCQPFSVAGKRQGTSDDRYLFDAIIETIKIIQPRRLFFENVSGILSSNAIIEIYESLNKLRYRCKPPLLLGSNDCGNIHKRQRVWIFAESESLRCGGWEAQECGDERSFRKPLEQKRAAFWSEAERCTVREIQSTDIGSERAQRGRSQEIQRQSIVQRSKNIRSLEDLLSRPGVPKPLLCGVDDELPNRSKRLKAVGNGQDPIVMATAYKLLSEM